MNDKLAAVEDTVEIAQDVRAEEFLEGLDVMVERAKHHAVALRNFQLSEAVVIRTEIRRHAAVDLPILLEATSERNAHKIAFQVIAPLVIWAN
ncbi:hypothetical protein AWV79_30555 [Cupriavidus sp. UYMMa02A]|nr:hypothetical protein AWV79_30555 [Cupriavidus sp. UYMMa02A]